MSDTNHLLSAHSSIRIKRQRQRDHPDLYFCWRRHGSRLLTNPDEVLMYAADMLDSRQQVDLRQSLNDTLNGSIKPAGGNSGRDGGASTFLAEEPLDY